MIPYRTFVRWFTVKEVILGLAQNFDGEVLYTLDQLTSAQIEISSDPTQVTDKNGNVIRNIYKSKSGTFTANSAMLSPAILQAQSGTLAENASDDSAITMPRISFIAPGGVLDVAEAREGTIHVMGRYFNGADDVELKAGTTAVAGKTYAYDDTLKTVTVPAAGEGLPEQYTIIYDVDRTSGMKIANTANSFPDTIKLTLYAAIMDPCSDTYKSAYIVLPSFQPDPSTTISFDSDNQETSFNGNLQIDFCSCQKALYYIYFDNEDAVVLGDCAQA